MGKKPLYYTFGNHMHWVDMQWLWGYGVLPGSVRDMLRLIDETGARGNVNFDAIGYEKMAAECPEALAELRDAIAAGKVEPVGCSYGQPYGLFHGGESNVRQLTYGVRATRRLLGVRPRAFWEEEFYFFPQLPQLLAQCGYTGACLFFQWTWHTPEVPKEPCSLILWEGIDGTRLPTLPRNELNVHQWPEEFDGLLDKAAELQSSKAADGDFAPAIVQWLELMPSRDWMCRSEVLLPRLKELMADPRFEVRARTVSPLIEELQESPPRKRGDATRPPPSVHTAIPVRRYTMDDVWHGMTLGKNADAHPRASRRTEQSILEAEAIAALAGVFGRPYPSWDAYPAWELDESWRGTLAAQHHDNHECEGLCGFVAANQFGSASNAAFEVWCRSMSRIQARCGAQAESNPLGWAFTKFRRTNRAFQALDLPPFGFAASGRYRRVRPQRTRVERQGDSIRIARSDIEVEIDAVRGRLTQIRSPAFPGGALAVPLLDLRMRVGKRDWRLPRAPRVDEESDGVSLWFKRGSDEVPVSVGLAPDRPAVDIEFLDIPGPRPDPGLSSALRMEFACAFDVRSVLADSPFSVEAVRGSSRARRKYPRGDWMTSPQWFEEVDRPFTAFSFADFVRDDGAGLLVSHNGGQQWLRTGRGAHAVLNAYDPWDESRYDPSIDGFVMFRLEPHGPLTNADRVRRAAEFGHITFETRGATSIRSAPPGLAVGGGTATPKKDVPSAFGGLEVCNAPNVLAHAFFRESMKSGEHLPDWTGHRMFKESDGACDHPYVIRLVEWNGAPAEVVLKLPGQVAMAAKTNVMGEVRDEETQRRRDEDVEPRTGWSWADTCWLEAAHPVEPPEWARGAKLKGEPITWSALRFRMRPREIATIYADLVMGRKQWRDLDAKREVWATVHRK
ncbi:MAG: hypothetical protein ACKVU4_06530 [Phycisphaerales bacterium]